MKYSQIITIDQIGPHRYNVLIQLVNNDTQNQQYNGTNHQPESRRTLLRPFDNLQVHVGLEQEGSNVRIYASGLLRVNRRVVPNLVVWDASGLAGAMAGKGTLWLAAHFAQQWEQRTRTGSF